MFSDFKFVVYWWFIHFVFGAATLPFIVNIFPKFYDRGYVFSKIFSILLVTYLILVTGILGILPFNLASVYLCLGVVLIVSWGRMLINRQKSFNFLGLLRHLSKYFIIEEIIFFLVLAFWTFIRGFNPELESLEKFMDWGFVNSALRSTKLPPSDMWYAQNPINYYYFGHLYTAVLTRFSALPSLLTYNLSIASIAALSFTAVFSLSSNIYIKLSQKAARISVRPSVLFFGLLTALLVTFSGNLHTVFKIGKNYYETTGSFLHYDPQTLQDSIDRYWYPDATRFIGFDPDIDNKTIHEFPLYSFVVSDLHGHMNGIPNVIFILAFYFSAIILASPKSPSNLFRLAFTGLMLSIAYMTNAWDIAVYGLVFAAVTFFSNLPHLGLWRSLLRTISSGLAVLAFWYLYTLPFSLHFVPMAEGLRWVDARSPFYQLFVLYGGFWLITLPFLGFIAWKLISLIRQKTALSPVDIFIFSLLIIATILVTVPEVFYIKDIYIFEHRRANTMFKLVYQAFILYSIAIPYCISRLSRLISFKPAKIVYQIISVLVISIHLIYPYFAIHSNYGNRQYAGLSEASKFFEDTYPDNWQVINWLNRNVSGLPTIVEAVGDSYTHYNQISMATGLPTIEGWLVHEWLWRGGYDGPGSRAEEVARIYESDDPSEVRPILDKYGVEYIIVGKLEKEKYPSLDTDKFASLGGSVAFISGDTKVYQFPR